MESSAGSAPSQSRLLDGFAERFKAVAEKNAAERNQCWCGGKGGRGRQTVDMPDGDWVEIFYEYCSCPKGEEVRAADERVKERAQKARWQKKLQRLWQDSGIPKRFAAFSLSTSPLNATCPALIQQLTWPEPPEEEAEEEAWDRWRPAADSWERSWFFWGECGVGKTGLAVGIAREYIRNKTDAVLFCPVPDLLGELRDTYKGHGDVSEGQLLRKYAEVPLLILDDLGVEHVKDVGWLEDRLYQIIGKRHAEERMTVFTSNLDLDSLAVRIGERLIWRIVEMCGEGHILRIDGPNLRDRAAGPSASTAGDSAPILGLAGATHAPEG